MASKVTFKINGKTHEVTDPILVWGIGVPVFLFAMGLLWLVAGGVLVAALLALVALPLLAGLYGLKGLVRRLARRFR